MVIYYKNCYWEEKTAYFSTFKHPNSGEDCLGFFLPKIDGIINLGKVDTSTLSAQRKRYEIEKAIAEHNFVNLSLVAGFKEFISRENCNNITFRAFPYRF